MDLGHILSGPDNDSHMLDKIPSRVLCPACRSRIDKTYYRKEFQPKKPHFDFSFTYDGYCIVSRRFQEFCIRNEYPGLDFHSLGDGSFFWFMPRSTVRFDAKKRQTRFENFCSACNQYAVVVGATPGFLVEEHPLPDGFYVTDIEFGDRTEKSPLYIVGVETQRKLKREKMKGLQFEPIQKSTPG